MASYTLRPYQADAVDKGVKYFNSDSKNPSVIVGPTACGKSLIISEIANRLSEPTLVLQPSKELLEQNIGKLKAINPDAECSIYSASLNSRKISKLTYATLGTIKKDIAGLKKIGVKNLIIDECFKGDTELLTENGFVRFDELDKNVRVAQYDGGHIEFVEPLGYVEREHDGEMVVFDTKDGKFTMTSGHEQLYINGYGKEVKEEIGKFNAKNKYFLIDSGSGIKSYCMTSYEKLLVLCRFFGSIIHSTDRGTRVWFNFSNPIRINRLRELASQAGCPLSQLKREGNFLTFSLFMKTMKNTKSLKENLPLVDSAVKCRELIQEVLFWHDKFEPWDDWNSATFYVSDMETIDYLQAVCAMCGVTTRIKKIKNVKAYVFLMKKNAPKRFIRSMSISREQYKGKVYCVTVPSNNIIVRQNNNVLVTGNCHNKYSPDPESEFSSFMKEMKFSKVLGFTATPFRLKSYRIGFENFSRLNMLNRLRPCFFKDIIHVIQIQDIIGMGYWSPLKYERWIFDKSLLSVNSSGADYTEASVKKALEKNKTNNGIYVRIKRMLESGERKSILAFIDSVDNANILHKFTNEKLGNVAGIITADTPVRERAKTVDDFRSGKLKVLYNMNTLTLGFDHPGIDCVMMGRPTMSLAVFYQVVGRGCRIDPKKNDCLIIDCCSNTETFGHVESLQILNYPGYGWGVFNSSGCVTGCEVGEIIPFDVLQRNAAERQNLSHYENKDAQLTQQIISKYFVA